MIGNDWNLCPKCNGVHPVGFACLSRQVFINEKPVSDCMHDNCPSCRGTGVRMDGLGMCVHGISCPCKKCKTYG